MPPFASTLLDAAEATLQQHLAGIAAASPLPVLGAPIIPPTIPPGALAPAPAAPPGRPEPPPGIYVQIYRGAIPGSPAQKRDALERYLDTIRGLGLPGVVFHGFCQDLADHWDGLATLALHRSLVPIAAWGLDSKDLTAQQKGTLVGDVLARPTCAAGLLDAEGQWDSDLGPADDMDEAGAIALGKALRRVAPGALVGDQPWYAIDSHGSVRRTAKPIEQGGVFAGFPVDEFAVTCAWGRFRQAYIYNAQGAGYASTFARMDRDWDAIAPALRSVGLERPLRVTIQGYRWNLHEQVHCLLDRCVRPAVPLMMWAEPMPDETAMKAIRAALWLQREGYARPCVDARDAVRAAQHALGHGLSVDGWWGPETHAAAGLL